jgi:hypothetical protein
MAEGRGGAAGWIGTIAFVLILNLLSYLFNWGWYFW